MLCTLQLGTNLGNKRNNLKLCIKCIKEKIGKVIMQSSLYETEPWNFKSTHLFYNMALEINTKLNPIALLKSLKEIESEMGRINTSSICYENRIIDIDILFYENKIINLVDLTVPHPYLHLRKFTLIPLNEILPGFYHPILKSDISTLLNNCTDTSIVTNIGYL